MVSLTEQARKKLQAIAAKAPTDQRIVWDIVSMGFG